MVQAITNQGMSLEAFWQQQQEAPFEIIDGEIVPMSPTVLGHSYLVRLLFRAFDSFLVSNPTWEVFTETTFVIPGADSPNWVTGSLEPDVMVLRKTDVEALMAANPDWRERPSTIIPVLVVEVISTNDRYPILLRKVAQYLDLGVQVILLINPRRKTVSIYRSGNDEPDILGSEDILTVNDLLPGFSLSLKQLFE